MLKNLKFKTLIISFLLLTSCLLLSTSAAYALTEENASQPVSEGTAQAESATADPQQTDASAPAEEAVTSPDSPASASSSSSGINAEVVFTDWTVNPINVIPAGNSGAATTSIPIIVPPGRKGIEPRISLNYNSNFRNGWIGVGWSVDMGAIQRNTKRGVNYNANDYLVTVNSSSSELVSQSSWGTNYYEAKIEGAFSKYYYNSATGGWEVITKEGTKYYYGTTAASRQDSGSNVFKWSLDKVQDTNGNYMTITYYKNQGEIYLERIDYTGNTAGLNPTNYVKFYRENRTDTPDMYATNFVVKTAYRLKTIEIIANGNRARAYTLKYDADPNTSGDQYSLSTGQSLLSSIQQFGNDAAVNQSNGDITSGTALPTITVTWTKTDKAFQYTNWTTASFGSAGTADETLSRYRVGDFNGDGKSDMLYIDTNGQPWVALSTGNSFLAGTNWKSNSWIGFGSVSDARKRYLIGDFNGDGKTDLMIITNSTTLVSLSDGTKFPLQQNWTPTGMPTYSFGTSDDIHYLFHLGDLNDDGKSDLVYFYGGEPWVALSNGSSFLSASNWKNSLFWCIDGGNDFIGTHYRLGDISGDGMSDFINIRGCLGDVTVALSTGNGFKAMETWVPWDGFDDSIYPEEAGYRYHMGDFNSDGLIDLLHITKTDGSPRVAISTGSSFSVSNWVGGFWVGTGSSIDAANRYHVADFTGDGMTDVLHILVGQIYVDPSSGSKFTGHEQWLPDWTINDPGYPENAGSRYFIGDFNGDGMSDVNYIDTSALHSVAISKGQFPDRLSSISNGIGGTTIISYQPSSAYTNTLLPFIVQTVSSVTINDGNGNSSTTNFTYSGGYFDYSDREYRGFQYVKATAPNGTTTESWFYQDDVFKGLPSEQVTKDSSGNIYTRSVNTFNSTSPYTGVNFPYLYQKDDYVYDGTSTAKQATTSFTYDSYGNITRKYYYGDVAVTDDERDENTEYLYDTANLG